MMRHSVCAAAPAGHALRPPRGSRQGDARAPRRRGRSGPARARPPQHRAPGRGAGCVRGSPLPAMVWPAMKRSTAQLQRAEPATRATPSTTT